MRIDYLNLLAFGHFTDYELSFDPEKNFHLIYGPNEAGKSTTLRSITNFLYGFPQKTNDSFFHSNAKLRIEGQIRNANGEALLYIRRKGRKDTILGLDNNPIDEKELNKFLSGMSEQQFLNMFALDHVRLREGGENLLQSGGNAGESVFSAASGISVLRKILEKLEKASGDLYKKSGSNPELNKLLKQEKELKKQIGEYQLKIQAWKELERNFTEQKQETENLKAREKELRTMLEKLQRVKGILPQIAKLKEAQSRLEELRDVPELPNGIEEMRMNAQTNLSKANSDKERIEKDLQEKERKILEMTIPELILEQSNVIEGLNRELQGFQNHEIMLPELEGRRKQLEDQVLTLMKEIDSNYASLEHIDKYRLSAAKKETIRELSKHKLSLDRDFERIENDLKVLTKDLEMKIEELEKIPEGQNVDDLESVIDRVKRAGGIELTLNTHTEEKLQKERLLEVEIKNLPLWNGTYQELVQLKIPSLPETLKKFEKDQDVLLLKLQKVLDKIQEYKEFIEINEEKIRTIDSLAEIPTAEELLTIRKNRDTGWQIIRTKLESGEIDEVSLEIYRNGREITEVYEEQVRDADHIADTMRLEATKVADKNKLLADIESYKGKITGLKMEEKHLEEELAQWKKAWHELWHPTGMIPLTPQEMKEWILKYELIKGLVFEYNELRETIGEIENQINQFVSLLTNSLQGIISLPENRTVDSLLSLAEKQLKRIRENENNRNLFMLKLSEVEGRINDKKNEKLDLESKISAWKNQWNKTVQGTNISESILPSVAEKLLIQYENCSNTFEEFQRMTKEIEVTKEQITFYKNKVGGVSTTIQIQSDDLRTEMVVNTLYAKLQKAKADHEVCNNLRNEMLRLQEELKKVSLNKELAQEKITELLRIAKCEDISQLVEVERKYKNKQDCVKHIQGIEEGMLEIGNGRSVNELIKEAAQYEADQITGELEEIKRELIQIEDKRPELEQAYGVVKNEYEEKIQGNNTNSAQAEQDKESIHAKLASVTEQYIQVKLASILLQKGIEHYRNQNQNPIIQKASEHFARLTLGSFVGLTVDYNEKDESILMGVRENGEKVMIDGMSDGTTDQLYLSLRLASIQKYVNENEPIPFIVDDILVHFDDIRSKETLKIMLELSRSTQIIFFTHHARLLEIMAEISSQQEYQLIEITPSQAILS